MHEEYREVDDNAGVAEIAGALDDWYGSLGRQFGPLSRPQRRMLHLLSADKAVRVSDLTDQLGLTTAGTTRMLNTLEEAGYATRARLPDTDQRQVYVTLTPAGELALNEAWAVFCQRVQTTLAKLSQEEQEILAHLLRKMNE